MTILMNNVLELKMLYENISKQVVPVKLAYKFTKLFTPILAEAEFYSKEMNKILDECGEKDENGYLKVNAEGTSVRIKEDCTETLSKKLKELESIEVELKDITFTIEELNELKLSVGEFNLLMPFITDEE